MVSFNNEPVGRTWGSSIMSQWVEQNMGSFNNGPVGRTWGPSIMTQWVEHGVLPWRIDGWSLVFQSSNQPVLLSYLQIGLYIITGYIQSLWVEQVVPNQFSYESLQIHLYIITGYIQQSQWAEGAWCPKPVI